MKYLINYRHKLQAWAGEFQQGLPCWNACKEWKTWGKQLLKSPQTFCNALLILFCYFLCSSSVSAKAVAGHSVPMQKTRSVILPPRTAHMQRTGTRAGAVPRAPTVPLGNCCCFCHTHTLFGIEAERLDILWYKGNLFPFSVLSSKVPSCPSSQRWQNKSILHTHSNSLNTYTSYYIFTLIRSRGLSFLRRSDQGNVVCGV